MIEATEEEIKHLRKLRGIALQKEDHSYAAFLTQKITILKGAEAQHETYNPRDATEPK